MSWYFRIEDENGLDPNLREYGWNDDYGTPVSAASMDELIANEIQMEINGSSRRSVFSCSKSLGVALFKFNAYADNPLYLINVNLRNSVIFDIINKKNKIKTKYIPYDIRDLDYPFKREYGKKDIFLLNYAIDVADNEALDKYLRNYTSAKTGIKARISPQKDKEVVIRHMSDDIVIRDNIGAVYLIYCLHYKTQFLNNNTVMSCLDNLFCKEIEDVRERNAFGHLIRYLYNNWEHEHEQSAQIISEKQNEGRLFPSYDAYYMAWEVLDGEYEVAWENTSHYIHERLLEPIWKIWYMVNQHNI